MFTINIATAPNSTPGAADPFYLEVSSVALSGPAIYQFPPSGSTSSFNVPVSSIAVSFDLECFVRVYGQAPQSLKFEFSGLQDGDSLNLLRHEPMSFTATVFHAHPKMPIGCIAKCADGSQAQGCVECRSGKLVGKICC